MDVPRVAEAHAPRAAILGSRTVKNLLGTWSGVSDRVVLVDSLAGNLERVGGWIPLGDAVRVMPLDSHHAPHFQGVTLYSGTADVPRHEEPATADEWLDGPSYAFLVDFLHPDGSVALRLYYQDAVPAAPAGLAPEALMEERPVDLGELLPTAGVEDALDPVQRRAVLRGPAGPGLRRRVVAPRALHRVPLPGGARPLVRAAPPA